MTPNYETSPAVREQAERANLPAIIPTPPPRRRPSRWPRRVFSSVIVLIAAGGTGYWWWLRSRPAFQPGIVWGNGRLEADEVDIDTKFAGRILELHADEGDMVKAGQVVAVMDTRDLPAQLEQYLEMVQQYQRMSEQAKESFASQQAVVKLDQQEVARTSYLVQRGFATQQTLDQQTQQTEQRARHA